MMCKLKTHHINIAEHEWDAFRNTPNVVSLVVHRFLQRTFQEPTKLVVESSGAGRLELTVNALGQLHSYDDTPAVEFISYTGTARGGVPIFEVHDRSFWLHCGRLHRTLGPSIIGHHSDNRKQHGSGTWWVRGELIGSASHFEQLLTEKEREQYFWCKIKEPWRYNDL